MKTMRFRILSCKPTAEHQQKRVGDLQDCKRALSLQIISFEKWVLVIFRTWPQDLGTISNIIVRYRCPDNPLVHMAPENVFGDVKIWIPASKTFSGAL